MKFKLLILVLTVLSNITFGQRKTQKKSYPANLDKIENIKSSYTGCTLGPCYNWWSIALKDSDELLMQSGAHHPPGARSRYFTIGTWKIFGDTLKLNIIPESLDPDFMRTEYRIISLYNCELLIPMDNSENLDVLLKDLQLKFEQSENYKEFRDYQNSERIISRFFYDFVMSDYSTDKKLLVRREKLN
jgi:hypothetical protein